jgi:hypothetical protein
VLTPAALRRWSDERLIEELLVMLTLGEATTAKPLSREVLRRNLTTQAEQRARAYTAAERQRRGQ